MDLGVAEIAKAINGVIANNININARIKNIITDSRAALPESLFFAIKGENLNGHDFISDAVAKGAVGYAAQNNFDFNNNINASAIIVNDTLQALLDLAGYYKSLFKNLNITVGVTGSAGKTTTKELIYNILAEKFKTQKNPGNHNTDRGVAHTLFELREDTEALVLEMGMSAFGEISRLSKIANPDTAVITNIGTSHIENLGSHEGIKKAKFEILDGMKSGANANIILNADDKFLYAEKNKTGANRREIFFGIDNKNADFAAGNIKFDYAKNASEFDLDGGRFIVPALGAHNIYSALPAIITGKIYGLANEEIQAGLNKFENAGMRQNIYEYNGVIIIDDCYNASLESFRAAFGVLDGLAAHTNGKKIAAISDVLETGQFAEAIHAEIGETAAKKNIKAYISGEKSKSAYDAMRAAGGDCEYIEEKSEIARAVISNGVKKGDVILFKASRGMALETVLEDFKNLI